MLAAINVPHYLQVVFVLNFTQSKPRTKCLQQFCCQWRF